MTTLALPERITSKIDTQESGCWLWMGTLSTRGYGRLWCDGKVRQAHRVVYEILVGPIPSGLQLDHLCRVRRCVNPQHLEPVTNRENGRRGTVAQVNRARQLGKTHCKHGHSLSDAYWDRTAGRRRCRPCTLSANSRSRRGA